MNSYPEREAHFLKYHTVYLTEQLWKQWTAEMNYKGSL